jgi:CheY-like chemotaxis protein
MFKECVILHVDDDTNDSTVFQRALMSKGFHGTYRRVRRVKTAKDYLSARNCYADATLFPQPEIIVTDLSIQGENGVDLIRWIRRHSDYRETPVIAFSASASAKMQRLSMEAGATCFLEKTLDYSDQIMKVRQMVEYRPRKYLSRLVCVALKFLWPYAMTTLEVSDEFIELAF